MLTRPFSGLDVVAAGIGQGPEELNDMPVRRAIAILTTAAMVAIQPTLAAADPWKDESGRGHGEVKREWKSGGCKYEYKAGRKGVKEEYKCDGPGYAAAPASWVPPGHRRPGYYTGGGPAPLDLGVGRCDRELIGQILGGAAGAAAGSQIGAGTGRVVAIAGGTLAGFLLGGEIGRTMDRADQLCADQILEFAPDGQPVAWTDPRSDGAYEVLPQGTFEARDGRYCREYTARSRVGGRDVQTYGTACRQPDGSWQIVN